MDYQVLNLVGSETTKRDYRTGVEMHYHTEFTRFEIEVRHERYY